ncbi:MAG TPA: hypothetical protein K8V84_16355 [Nocardiopsis listeri]|uniref:hypothetical protein n=1 Tax=Nocardiopsis listeri TaxID=53440 RepID=UPI001D2AE791|nr:hypothetical protein [Nocardiopsis listeri]HJE60056.1 hypothetical protein [Nocardiopsis listeri]
MTQPKRLTARTVILAAGAAGFVALGAGVAGAQDLQTPMHDIAPTVERALVEGVAPAMHKIAPEGVGPIAGTALEELQAGANDPGHGAPDLGAVLPDSPLADAVTEAQDATGLDGDPHDTIGHAAGESLEAGAQDAGVALEDTARGAGGTVEDKAQEVLPNTVVAVTDLRDETLTLPESEAPTLPLSHPESELPTAPNVWDLAAGFGVRTPDRIQDVVESNPVTSDNHVDLGEEEVLGTVGNRAWDDEVTTVPQSSPQTPGLTDLTDGLAQGVSSGEAKPVDVNGPLADAQLPQVAEGLDTTAAEDLVAGLSRGTDLLGDVDTSDLVSIEGGTAEQETPEGMVEHPTFMDLPGSEALPVVS